MSRHAAMLSAALRMGNPPCTIRAAGEEARGPERGRPRPQRWLPGVSWLICVCLFLLIAAVSARGQTVTAMLDRSTISVGESATLSLIFQGGSPESPPPVPSQPNLSVNFLRRSSRIEINNGRASSSETFDYSLVATQPGTYTIPSIQVAAGGKLVRTQPLRLTVLKASTGAVAADGSLRRAFLKLIVPKTGVYVGEVFPVDIQLFVTAGQDLQWQPMEGEGFLFGKMSQPMQTQTQIRGVVYQVVTVKMWASAAKAGKLTLGPARCSLILHVPQQGRRRDPFGDPLSDAFDLFGPPVLKQPINLVSEAVDIEALPLPSDNVPSDFTGAVGEFSLAVSASPTNVVVGDPVTLKIQIAGTGGIESLALPQIDWREFRAYPPTSSVQTTDALGITGVKSFEQVIIPQSVAVKEVPAISFSYFDPAQRAYRTLKQPAIALAVRPSAGGQPQPTVVAGAPSQEQPAAPRDIVHIKQHLGMIEQWQPPLVRQGWFLGLQAVPVLLWIVSLVWRKYQDRLASDPRLRRRRRVNQFVNAQLKELRRLAQENRAEEFFAAIFRALQEQIGERLDLPASSITEAVLDEQLRPRHVSEELLRMLHELFQACNQARYAPVRTAPELMEFVPMVEQAIAGLRELSNEA